MAKRRGEGVDLMILGKRESSVDRFCGISCLCYRGESRMWYLVGVVWVELYRKSKNLLFFYINFVLY